MNDTNDMASKALAALFFDRCVNNESILELLSCYSCTNDFDLEAGAQVNFVRFLRIVIDNIDKFSPDRVEQCISVFFRRKCLQDKAIFGILASYKNGEGDEIDSAGSISMFIEFLQMVVDNL